MKRYYAYIAASKSKTLYIGVTSNIEKRMYEHRKKLLGGFTAKYNINRLVYAEETNDVYEALSREKQLKGLLRRKKIALIESINPQWKDLS